MNFQPHLEIWPIYTFDLFLTVAEKSGLTRMEPILTYSTSSLVFQYPRDWGPSPGSISWVYAGASKHGTARPERGGKIYMFPTLSVFGSVLHKKNKLWG